MCRIIATSVSLLIMTEDGHELISKIFHLHRIDFQATPAKWRHVEVNASDFVHSDCGLWLQVVAKLIVALSQH